MKSSDMLPSAVLLLRKEKETGERKDLYISKDGQEEETKGGEGRDGGMVLLLRPCFRARGGVDSSPEDEAPLVRLL